LLQRVRRRVSRALADRLITRPARQGLRGRFLSVCFDDFPVTAATTGADVLEEFGARGTYYFAAGLAGTTGSVGPIADADAARALVDRGHELGCHTHGHLPCPSLSRTALLASLQANQQAVDFCRLQTFAYPFGYFDWTAKAAAAERFATVRTGLKGLNQGRIDLAGLRAVPLYQPMGEAGVDRWLDALAQAGPDAWLILYTHDVQPQPSPFGCTPQLLAHCLRRARAEGWAIDTVGAVAAPLHRA
jgi:peptidoglycan/xylan/chitin deacetylase (PgdA/CDA1 family)